jgi:hypothetical protein
MREIPNPRRISSSWRQHLDSFGSQSTIHYRQMSSQFPSLNTIQLPTQTYPNSRKLPRYSVVIAGVLFARHLPPHSAERLLFHHASCLGRVPKLAAFTRNDYDTPSARQVALADEIRKLRAYE